MVLLKKYFERLRLAKVWGTGRVLPARQCKNQMFQMCTAMHRQKERELARKSLDLSASTRKSYSRTPEKSAVQSYRTESPQVPKICLRRNSPSTKKSISKTPTRHAHSIHQSPERNHPKFHKEQRKNSAKLMSDPYKKLVGEYLEQSKSFVKSREGKIFCVQQKITRTTLDNQN